MGVIERFKRSWNVFTNNEQQNGRFFDYGSSYATRPDLPQLTRGNERSIITSIYSQIAVDVASVMIEHIRTDDQGRYLDTIKSNLNYCLTEEANLDQSAYAFKINQVLSLCDKGVVAICPINYRGNPTLGDSYDILDMRVGEVLRWMPQDVTVLVYDEKTGKKTEVTLPKRMVAIVENPLAAIMNGPAYNWRIK